MVAPYNSGYRQGGGARPVRRVGQIRDRMQAVHARKSPATPAVEQVNISFGNFEFQDMKSLGQRGGGVRELHTLLKKARRQEASHQQLIRSDAGVTMRNDELLQTALERAGGAKIKDDPTRIARALAKRRNKKRRSAKQWEARRQHLVDSVENVVKDRSVEKQAMRAKREAKKEKRKGGGGGRGAGGGSRGSGGGRGGGSRGSGGGRGGGSRGSGGGRGGGSRGSGGGRGGGGRDAKKSRGGGGKQGRGGGGRGGKGRGGGGGRGRGGGKR